MPQPYIVAIVGPSGVGKTVVSEIIQTELGDAVHIDLDDYFKNWEKFPHVGEWINWDLPEDLNFTLLASDLRKLKSGKSVRVFILDRITHKRSEKTISPRSIILVEGFLILFDKKLRELFDLKIYIETSTETQVQRRLQRSIRRDEDHHREGYLRKVVVPNYKKYGLPTKKFVDYIVDGERPLEKVTEEVKKIIEKVYKQFK